MYIISDLAFTHLITDLQLIVYITLLIQNDSSEYVFIFNQL